MSADTPSDDFFNDLSQQPSTERNGAARSPNPRRQSNDAGAETEGHSKSKRIACVLCRKRKLRCDGQRPTCGTCKRLSHDCAYDQARRKSGPKRGYVKALEARLQQVETLLKTQESNDENQDVQDGVQPSFTMGSAPSSTHAVTGDPMNLIGNIEGIPQMPALGSTTPQNSLNMLPNGGSLDVTSGEEPISWEMIGLGLEEPLPNQDVINELHQIYFQKIHPSVPMIHRPRYLAAMNLAPHMRPPICLRYIMWCLAASITEKYETLQEHLYHRARKYAQMDEMKGHGEGMITLAHCQTWILITLYEFKLMYFPRAWLSTGRAVRLAQMMSLHRLDGMGLDVKQCLPPPRDWTEREERRRTFWMAFCTDRYASIGTGWPMTVEEKDIMTNLPSSEEAFDRSKPMPTTSLDQALRPSGAASLSSFGGVILMACLFGRNLTHLHRPGPDDNDEDADGEFWKRHRHMENILNNTALAMPDSLRLPAGIGDPNVVFLNMNIHTSAICLHQAAIFKADKYRLPSNIGSESRVRCVTAAAEIARIMKMISHVDLSAMNPFISFCLYVAARVFVQYLKFRPKDQHMTSSLQFLLTAMQALKRKNPLTESFLVQLDLDLEGAGIDVGQHKPDWYSGNVLSDVPVNTDSVRCSPIFEIRESQSARASINTFGNTGLALHSQPNQTADTESPGPPFHTARADINLDVEPTPYSFMSRHAQVLSELPSRQKSSHPPDLSQNNHHGHAVGTVNSVSPPSDMDLSPGGSGDQPSPSTLNSHRGPSSHTSFTPPHRDPHQQQNGRVPGAAIFNAAEQNFVFFPDAIPAGDGQNASFPMHPWELGTTGASTGMTPISDDTWGQMLDDTRMTSVAGEPFQGLPGWEGVGPGHGFDVFGKRVNC